MTLRLIFIICLIAFRSGATPFMFLNPASQATAVYPIDLMPNQVGAAFSMIPLSASYTNAAITLRSASNGTSSNFYFTGQTLDVLSISNHLGLRSGSNVYSWTNGFITQWWDQSSNAFHGVQTTNGNQSRFRLLNEVGTPAMFNANYYETGYLIVSNLVVQQTNFAAYWVIIGSDYTRTVSTNAQEGTFPNMSFGTPANTYFRKEVLTNRAVVRAVGTATRMFNVGHPNLTLDVGSMSAYAGGLRLTAQGTNWVQTNTWGVAGLQTNLWLGRISTDLMMRGQLAAFIVYTNGHTPAQQSTMISNLAAAFNIALPRKTLMIFDGDSISAGYDENGLFGMNQTDIREQSPGAILLSLLGSNNIHGISMGVAGTYLVNNGVGRSVESGVTNRVHPLATNSYVDKWYVLNAGVNDLRAAANVPPTDTGHTNTFWQTMLTSLSNICTGLSNAGFKTMVSTILTNGNETTNAGAAISWTRLTYNTNLALQWTNFATAFVDPTTNTIAFQSDNLHPNRAGNTNIAQSYKAVIQPLLQ